MLLSAGFAFDRMAWKYDALWTNTPIGTAQREAVWRWIDPLFQPGDSILDLGCGTGADAVHMMNYGLHVTGVDASTEMASLARASGVEAQHLALENLDRLDGVYDGVISNFGVLNCVDDLRGLGIQLSRLTRRNSYLAVCVMGPVCLWETCHYLKRTRPRKAFRRWRRGGSVASMGVSLSYPTIHQIRSAFQNHFKLVTWVGIGLAVPPSYILGLSASAVMRLQKVDRHLAHRPLLRMFSDHRLLLFRRI
ncbi:MAG TPA: class I SAM-dependent methyltransferase [Bryobacteraceae bacterium]|nr:class I SAM-dependent methyltransferase [Bryobacteraceae bacterium]